jgi:hypothetical protein
MKPLIGALAFLALASSGCGDNSTSFACLLGTGTTQLCIETTITPPSGPADCGGGTHVDSCPRAGADGACIHSFSSGSASLSQTIWYYSGTAGETSQEMSDCTNNGGTWIQP